MARTQTMVQLSTDLLGALDAEAARTGQSRSAIIRQAVNAYLADSREARITEQLVAGYSRLPQGAGDEWGDLEAQTRAAAERTLRRLDAEESAAGMSW